MDFYAGKVMGDSTITQPKGHTPLLIFRKLCLSYLDFGTVWGLIVLRDRLPAQEWIRHGIDNISDSGYIIGPIKLDGNE